MSEQQPHIEQPDTTGDASTEPAVRVPWLKNWKLITLIAAVALIVLAAGTIALVANRGPSEEQLAAQTAIDASIEAVESAQTKCLSAVESATETVETSVTGELGEVSAAYGEDSPEFADAVATIEGREQLSDDSCDATAVTLADGAVPLDEVDRITGANAATVSDLEDSIVDAERIADDAEVWLELITGLADAVNALDDAWVLFDAAAAEWDEFSSSVTISEVDEDARRTMQAIVQNLGNDRADEDLNPLSVSAHSTQADTVTAATDELTELLDKWTVLAQERYDDLRSEASSSPSGGTAPSGTSGKQSKSNPAPNSSDQASTSKGSGSKSGSGSSGGSGGDSNSSSGGGGFTGWADECRPEGGRDKYENGMIVGNRACTTPERVKSALSKYQGSAGNCSRHASVSSDSVSGHTSWAKGHYDLGPGYVKFDVAWGDIGGTGERLVTTTVSYCGD